MAKSKPIDYNDLINKSLKTLEQIMLTSDNEKLQLEAASKLLSVLAKNKQFIEENGEAQLSLDLALTMRKEIYGLEETK